MLGTTSTEHEHRLAAQLQAAWDDETAAVYADLLIARGDPHGELIAIDRALARAPTPELARRKHELLVGWLGDELAGVGWRDRDVQHGLLRRYACATTPEHSPADQLTALFAQIGDRVRALSIHGRDPELVGGLAVIAAHRRPWLTALTIERPIDRPDGTRPLPYMEWAAVVEATPNLRSLTLIGEAIVRSPVHPAIERLELHGPAVAIGAASIHSVHELGLTFSPRARFRPPDDAELRRLAGLVNPRTFPALRVLDLAGNEPPSFDRARRERVIAFLDAIEDLGPLARIRMPSVDADGAGYLREVLELYPALEIEVARMYDVLEISHARLHVPPLRPWPDSAHGRDALTVAIPPERWGEHLATSSLIADLEDQFDAMPAEARQAWLALWDFLDELPWEDEHGATVLRGFPAATLQCALEALEGNRRADTVAAILRDAELPAGAEVTISRYWGW